MKSIIETLYPMNRTLIGEGYDTALKYLGHLIDLEVIEIPSGTKLETWTVPDEWVVRDAWVKFKGEKILDYQKQPLSLITGSLPFRGTVNLEELKNHLHYAENRHDATLYEFKYYDKDWGFCIPFSSIKESGIDETKPLTVEGGVATRNKDKLLEGDYEVFIDTEYRPGTMKLGVHTIKGKSEREILLFAHLDHPFQANDNLSGVACLVDLATRLKADHTIKIVLCPETIGSIAYATTQDISKVDFVLAVDICGNKNIMTLQKSFTLNRLDSVAHLAIQGMGESYQKGGFRSAIGSDEYMFNDPLVGVPGILLTTFPYPEYHTSDDTPDIIDYDQIKRVQTAVERIIRIYEQDYIPVRQFKGPLFRSKYKIQTPGKLMNLSWDYFIYSMDGKKHLSELCTEFGLNFDFTYEHMEKLLADGVIKKHENRSTPSRKVKKQKASK